MAGRSIAIIGGGVAGLSTGVYALANGYRTRIFEHHSVAGGVCTAWTRGDYTFDCCIHWLMGAKPGCVMHSLYDEVGALAAGRLVRIDRYAGAVDEATGRRLDVTSDLDRLAADLRALSPADSAFTDRMARDIRRFVGVDLPGPDFGSSIAARARAMWQMRRAFTFLARRGNRSVGQVAQAVRDRFLHMTVMHLFAPDVPYLFLLMILAGLANGELAGIEGGSRAFAEAIERRYRTLGGEITFGATVQQILVEGDRAVGVKLADGSEHRADLVVSAADGRSTIFDMLGGRYVDAGVRHRYNAWPIFEPIVLVDFGLSKKWPASADVTMAFLERPMQIAGQPVGQFFVRTFSNHPEFAPEGHSVAQVVMTTDWHAWNRLSEDRRAYEAEKCRVADELAVRLEPYLPGIRGAIEEVDVATPRTFWRYSRNYRGAFEGFMMTPRTLTTRVPKTLPGLGSFYMAGQWVEPGGGVPTAIASGKNVVRLICGADKKEFRTAP
jgi:phytoene dehydrogenase-like protein